MLTKMKLNPNVKFENFTLEDYNPHPHLKVLLPFNLGL